MYESPPLLGATGPGRECLGACRSSPGRSTRVDPDLYQDGDYVVGASPACIQQQANTTRYFVESTSGAARRALRVGLRVALRPADPAGRSAIRGGVGETAIVAVESGPPSPKRGGVVPASRPGSVACVASGDGVVPPDGKRGGTIGVTVGSTGIDPVPVAPAASGSVAVDVGLPIMLEASFDVGAPVAASCSDVLRPRSCSTIQRCSVARSGRGPSLRTRTVATALRSSSWVPRAGPFEPIYPRDRARKCPQRLLRHGLWLRSIGDCAERSLWPPWPTDCSKPAS